MPMPSDLMCVSALCGQALEDIYLLVRKHPQMYYRARELNRLDDQIKNSKQLNKKDLQQMGAA